MEKPCPGSLILHITNLDVRTYATSTYWFGSKLPPCSMALSSISRKAVATSSFSERGRSDISWKNCTNLSAVFLSQRAMMLIHSGVADTSSMPSSQRGAVEAERTLSANEAGEERGEKKPEAPSRIAATTS